MRNPLVKEEKMMLERTGKHLQGKEASVKESYRTKPTPCNVFFLLLLSLQEVVQDIVTRTATK